jgi:phosphotransferase system enzyme I (PtsI)
VCLYGRRRQFFRTEISETQIKKETRRFRAAVRLAGLQLNNLIKKNENGRRENAAGVLDFHRTLLADQALLGDVEQKIAGQKINAEWAVKLTADAYVMQFKNIADERFRERQIDLEDVTDRILAALGGGHQDKGHLEKESIIVARELNPSTLIELSSNDVRGIVTEHGGWTSHTYILARELGIPAVTGIRSALRRLTTGDRVIVDGFVGDVVLRPTEETLRSLERTQRAESSRVHTTDSCEKTQTLDGRRIVIRANADLSGRYDNAKAEGACGIGLFRSEYIFNRFRGFPNEEEQFDAYSLIARSTGEHGVRIRTFDFSVDDVADQSEAKSKNPALGLRAIRLSLERETDFRAQIRALLRAAHETKIDIILPMISDVGEIRRSKAIIEEESKRLMGNRIQVGVPGIGIMVEVPAAVLAIDRILDEVDMLCLGTNDLVQYLLAVDRDNESVAKWFNSLNPAVVSAIKIVIDAAAARGKSCVICGEMAGSPFYVPLLIGLGATELSMNPSSISRVRDVISGIAYEEAVALARSIETCATPSEAEEVIEGYIRDNWSHLFKVRKSRY